MDVYNRRRQGVTKSDDALGRAGFTFNGLFAALAAFVFAQNCHEGHGISRHLPYRTDSAYGFSLQTRCLS